MTPYMNPIEHIWDALGRLVAGRQPPQQTLQELERGLLEEKDRIPQLLTRVLLATDHVILNHGQETWMTPELAPHLLTTTPTGGRYSSRQI
ncbi:hypothetical protein TNCV_50961 [Trichonephila clavipes]|nr:hypothetical protein TNCV_50961 [Trichonephila clavipes]